MPPVIDIQKPILTTLHTKSAANSISHVLETLPIISEVSKVENATTITTSDEFWHNGINTIGNVVIWLLKELLVLGMTVCIGMIFSFAYVLLGIAINLVMNIVYDIFASGGRPLIPTITMSSNTMLSQLQPLLGPPPMTGLAYHDLNISREHQVDFTLSILDNNPFCDELMELEQTCVICFEPLEDRSTVVATTCERPHILHRDCLRSWLLHSIEREHRCPLCRTALLP